MVLLSLQNAMLAYGDHPLLDNADLKIHRQERVCLVGRNGAGKSTLLKVLSGDVLLDSGDRQVVNGVVIARLQQDPPSATAMSVYEYVASGNEELGQMLSDFRQISLKAATDSSEQTLNAMARLQEQIESRDGWNFDNQINRAISWLGLDPEQSLQGLSGGWLRKVALAKALSCQPDLLLLDEPTNHLDIDTISWLEDFLLNFSGTIVFISHDRAFIQRLATRIVDIDRGVLTSWPGNYLQYLEGKAEWLRVEEEKNAQFDKKLAEEEAWIRQGIKARRTRNEGRVRALKALRQERQDRVERQGVSQMQLDEGARSGKLVFEAENLGFSWGDKTIINDFSFQVQRGDKIALVGPNGVGKSTLLKLLLGDLQPTQGHLRVGTKLQSAYFDQYRQTLDEEKSVMDNVADGKQEVTVNGRSRHVMGYLQDFLFPPKRAFTPVKALSGGEKNRLLLAKLFLRPTNLLVLDEPTNDLDVETLELLEELIANYQGTLFIVSHDRAFIDNTATQVWFFAGQGEIQTAVGGYQDLMRQISRQRDVAQVIEEKPTKSTEKKSRQTSSKKLSYKLQRELEELPENIARVENELAMLQEQVNQPDFFTQDAQMTQPVLDQLKQAEDALETLFNRWEELEELKTQ
ncbi:ABC transporter ATP-binding protein [Celerinatantimonas sp. MCCC 1A17872]|uniref:ATP-binding cassette ATPase Uup n=1 Tax=Celerinatantimonas sp. MCCC 1A17872 TaxID=3177514 RepID=UPI0038CBCD4E